MTCGQLMLRDFITYVCNDNKPDWWESLMSEYAELKGDTRSKSLLLLHRDIATIEQDIVLIERIVNQMANFYDERLGEMLRNDFDYDFEYRNDETLPNELQLTINIARNKLVEKNEMLSELGEMEDKETDKPISEIDFMVQIQSYAKWQGFAIPIDNTTVKQYLAIQKLYNLSNKPA
jgi:hypothetical protein